MSDGWVAVLVIAPFVALAAWLPVSFSRGQRNCDRLNAENAAHAEAWRALTDKDRAWVLDNGGTAPTAIYWEMR